MCKKKCPQIYTGIDSVCFILIMFSAKCFCTSVLKRLSVMDLSRYSARKTDYRYDKNF